MAIDPMDPALGLETQLQLATSLADPSRYPYMTPFQAALAPMFAQGQASRAGDLATQLAQQFGGARGDLLKALAAPSDPNNPQSPFAYAAGNPTMDPYAAFRLAQTTPEQAAQAAEATARGQLESTQAKVQGQRLTPNNPAIAFGAPGAGGGGAGGAGGGGGGGRGGTVPTNPPQQPLIPGGGHNAGAENAEFDRLLQSPQPADYAEKMAEMEKDPLKRARFIARARSKLGNGQPSATAPPVTTPLPGATSAPPT